MINLSKPCICSGWQDEEVVPMIEGAFPDDVFAEMQILKRRTPWLDLVRCKISGAYWYIGTDTVDDDYFVMRLDQRQVDAILDRDKWPEKFDKIPALWPDNNWLNIYHFSNLEDWQKKNQPK